ncbi:MAG: DUF6544 family protein [Capsulimonadales bacterium]|nr:DUF6544 family protein [Capsulimonadales bacterium]
MSDGDFARINTLEVLQTVLRGISNLCVKHIFVLILAPRQSSASDRRTLTDAPTTVSLTVRFDAEGRMETIRADGRPRTVGKETVMTPWEGQFRDYQEREGIRIPICGEVAWVLPSGRLPYWRGELTHLRYEVGT